MLDAVKADGDTTRDYQSERDEITRGLVQDVQHYAAQLEEVEKPISEFLPRFECTLNTIPGKRQEQTTGIDSDLQTVSQYHLWNAKKQNGIQDAGSAKKP